MAWEEKALAWLLRIVGLTAVTAVGPAVMPFEWMVTVNNWLLPDQLPDEPIVHYLTRSLSAMYAAHGAVVVYVSFNVRRYLPVIRLILLLAILFGLGMIVLDWAIELPLLWTLCEGPSIIAVGILALWLAARVGREPADSE